MCARTAGARAQTKKPFVVRAGDVPHPKHERHQHVLPFKFKDFELVSVSSRGRKCGINGRTRASLVGAVPDTPPAHALSCACAYAVCVRVHVHVLVREVQELGRLKHQPIIHVPNPEKLYRGFTHPHLQHEFDAVRPLPPSPPSPPFLPSSLGSSSVRFRPSEPAAGPRLAHGAATAISRVHLHGRVGCVCVQALSKLPVTWCCLPDTVVKARNLTDGKHAFQLKP